MKQTPLIILTVTLLGCTAIHNDVRPLPEESKISVPSVSIVDSVQIAIVRPDTIPVIAALDWVNYKCILLEKPPLFRRHGYEIFICSDTAVGCNKPIDTAYELSNRRIRYDTFVGDTLVVTEVIPDNGEWRVSFRDTKYSLVLHARTYKGALKDLLFVRDLNAAKERWLGKFVYSRKGIISIEGENGMLSSYKVARTDSLKVYDIRSGLTPLPVNPIWLVVLAPGEVKGFLSVRISWTNTMFDQMYDGVAWEDEVLEQNPSKLHNWDSVIWELIENHKIAVEMTQDQVFLSWGRPFTKTKKSYNGVDAECWTYSIQELYFSEKVLFAIQDISK